MSLGNQLSVKVYLIENKATKDIRKFPVDDDAVGSYEYLIGKTRQVFPDLLRQDLQLFWKDEEEDYLIISTDEELNLAIKEIPVGSTSLKLYVKEKQKTKASTEELMHHPGVSCDSCNSQIRGIRYKCTQCHDFDLCSPCESKGLHPAEHEMISIKTPRQYNTAYVIHHPSVSEHCRGRPFHGQFPESLFHGRSPFHCGFDGSQTTPCGKRSTEYEKKDNVANEEKFKECVEKLASAFGLDPEVAVSSAKSFYDDVHEELMKNEGNKDEDKIGKEEKDDDKKDDVLYVARSFGIDPTIIAHITTNLFPQSSEEKKTEGCKSKSQDQDVNLKHLSPTESTKVDEESKATKTEESQSTPTEEQKNIQEPTPIGLEEMVNHFAPQFGFNPETQQSPNGLGDLLQRMFQSFPAPNIPQATQESQNKQNETLKTPEEFLFVENKGDQLSEKEKQQQQQQQQLSEEEKEIQQQQRLEKALQKMEAMGFDNDGGWLSQLLVSKDLSIGRVLDALNPQN